jgi:hypothetical protein
VTDAEGRGISSLRIGQPFRVAAQFEAFVAIPDAIFEVGISTADGERVATMQSIDSGPPVKLVEGLNEVEVSIEMTLLPGEYSLDVAVHHETGISPDYVEGVFRLIGLNVPNEAEATWQWDTPVRGHIRPAASWSEAMPISGSSPGEAEASGLVTGPRAD